MKKNLIIILAAATLLSVTACDLEKTNPPAGEGNALVKERLYPIWKLTPQGKQWGYMNEAGATVVAPQYETAEYFSDEGTAVIGAEGKKGLISVKGNPILKPVYDALAIYSNNRWVGVRDGSWTEMVDKSGKAVYETGLAIHPMSEGGARVQEYVGDQVMEGYIDDSGAVTIEPKYLRGTDFVEQKAVVKKAEGDFAVIDLVGKELVSFKANAVLQPSENNFAFSKPGKGSALWGYMDMAGKVLIKPSFSDAKPFSGGIAVVGQKQKGIIRYGLIDIKGKFILHPKYEKIEDLGNGFFAVSRKVGPDAGIRSYPAAIFNGAGKRLTDYLYYETAACTKDTISVSDGNTTWVLDSAGTPMSTMPRLAGMGTVHQEGNLLVSQADDERAYFTLGGKLVWQSPWETALKDNIKLKRLKFRPDRAKIIYYPAIDGLTDETVKNAINTSLYQRFVGDGTPSVMADGVPEEAVWADYIGQLNKDLLIVEKRERRIGKADGAVQETIERIHLDITDGTAYGLGDLFRAGTDWQQLLADQVKAQIAKMPSEDAAGLNPERVLPVAEDRMFKAGKYGLVLYYNAAELGGSVPAPLEFIIPYAEMLKDISTENRMWNAFLKQDM